MTPRETVESLYAAFQRGDIPFILGKVAPDCMWRQSKHLPWGGDHLGPEGAGLFFTRLNEAVETTTFEILETYEAGDTVFSVGRYGGKARKTRKTSLSDFCFRWTVKNGMVTQYAG